MKRILRAALIGILTLISTPLLANDIGKNLIGTWIGSASLLTSKSIAAANGDFSKAVVDLNHKIIFTAAGNGLCIATVSYTTKTNVLTDSEGHTVNTNTMKNMPCLYYDNHIQMASNTGAQRNCIVNGNSMSCYAVISRADDQTVAVIKFKKQQ